MSLLLAICIAALVVAYWVRCRRAALKHQMRAIELIELLFADETVHEKDKDIAYVMYRMARHWWFMPLMSVMTPIAMTMGLVRGNLDKKAAVEGSRPIMDSIMQMYMTRNPLTTVVSMLVMLLSFAVILPTGILLNRIRAVPSLAAMYGSMASATATVSYSGKHHF